MGKPQSTRQLAKNTAAKKKALQKQLQRAREELELLDQQASQVNDELDGSLSPKNNGKFMNYVHSSHLSSQLIQPQLNSILFASIFVSLTLKC